MMQKDEVINVSNKVNKSIYDITEEEINELIDEVVKGIKEDWPTIYKIRYIYLEIGKRLYKDADFFFSADGKLGEENLSAHEIKDIYNNNFGRHVRGKLKVICKSASYILKLAYDRVGIKSKLIETNTTISIVSSDEEFLVNHWFLAINDDNGKIYFATLTPDLPYIQMNMDTRHFGSDIPYTRDFNGRVMQLYKGEKINNSTISREELKKIDMEIGYIKREYQYSDKGQINKEWLKQYDNASLYMLRDKLKDNKLLYRLEMIETDFYKSLIEFQKNNGENFSFLYDDVNSLSEEDWNIFIKIVCGYVLEKLENILGYKLNVLPPLNHKNWNYEAWLLNLCVQIQYDICLSLNNNEKDNFNDVYITIENFRYNKWSKQLKNKFGKNMNIFDYNNIIVILDKMNALVNCIKSNRKNGKLNELFENLAYHFIDEQSLYEYNLDEDGYLSNSYIANKFNKVFQNVFSCNEMITDFNQMGYAEKVVIIKDILLMMFPEITKNNSIKLPDYNEEYNALFNRIQLYPIKNKEDGFFSILFNILGDDKNYDYYFHYNAKSNTFKVANILEIYNDYIIISNRMKNRVNVEDLERIDEYPNHGRRKR